MTPRQSNIAGAFMVVFCLLLAVVKASGAALAWLSWPVLLFPLWVFPAAILSLAALCAAWLALAGVAHVFAVLLRELFGRKP